MGKVSQDSFQMLPLVLISLFILTANADVIDEDVDFSKIQDHFAVSNPAESKIFSIYEFMCTLFSRYHPKFENIS